jgi:hypothetical protein
MTSVISTDTNCKDAAMAFAEATSITISGSAKSFNRTGFAPNAGTLQTADGEYVLTVSHQYGKKHRRMIKLSNTKISADVLIPDQNVRNSADVHLVVTQPPNGYTAAELKAIVDGFLAFLTASSGAAVTKLLGGEV